jgi:hypothetical protein
MDPERVLIEEQIAYYRAHATEYDATSTPDADAFEADTNRIRDALRAFAPRGRSWSSPPARGSGRGSSLRTRTSSS